VEEFIGLLLSLGGLLQRRLQSDVGLDTGYVVERMDSLRADNLGIFVSVPWRCWSTDPFLLSRHMR
jgi:hypothetical protein